MRLIFPLLVRIHRNLTQKLFIELFLICIDKSDNYWKQILHRAVLATKTGCLNHQTAGFLRFMILLRVLRI